MACIKTGCLAYIEPYDEWAYGDAFELDGVYYFRLVQRFFEHPKNVPLHFTIHGYDNWFDKDTKMSTLISSVVTNHGYEGIPA